MKDTINQFVKVNIFREITVNWVTEVRGTLEIDLNKQSLLVLKCANIFLNLTVVIHCFVN